MNNTVIGILAHVDSGKTTLTETILYNSGHIKKIGRVDHGTAFLDNNEIEKKRGITIFSKQANFSIGERTFSILDTPGHVDFSPEMERTLQVLDYAILLVSGSEGVQSHTENLWDLLNKHNIPCLVFVNKMDIASQNQSQILNNLKEKLNINITDFTTDIAKEETQETLALSDDNAMKEYIEQGKLSIETIKRLIDERKIYPCYFGSALKLEGVENLMKGIFFYANAKHTKKDFLAKVFKIMRDKKDVRLTYVKILGGKLKVKDELEGIDGIGKPWKEKINEIRSYSGAKYDSLEEALPGDVCALVGLSNTLTGDVLGGKGEKDKELFEPVMTYAVNILSNHDNNTVYKYLKELEEEEPKLYVNWSNEKDTINVQLMGLVQLEIIKNILKERYSLEIEFSEGNIIYKETISKRSYGVGHFEPLKHYAEVHLMLVPTGEGSGLTFALDCPEDDLEISWQKLILSHLKEKTHRGVLTNSQITDMKITVVGGRAHKKHTEGGDFREATYRALRQGLAQGESILLEPWVNFKARMKTEYIGRFLSDVDRLKGKSTPPIMDGEFSIIEGSGPAKDFNSYQLEMNNYAKGTGNITFKQGVYLPCHHQEEIIKNFNYDFENDFYNPADSVFCEKGKGYVVKWNMVQNFMHVESKETKHVAKEKELKRRVINYREELVSDKELMGIFEKTYGPIKKNKLFKNDMVSKNNDLYSYNQPKKTLEQRDEFLLIDGYNLIYSWDELKELLAVDFGSARDKLIDIISNYAGINKTNVIMVFDAYKVKDNQGSVNNINNISVVYTKTAETADMFIEKTTFKIAKKHNVRVVTSDVMEQMIITGHGAIKVSCEAFIEEVKLVEEKIRDALY